MILADPVGSVLAPLVKTGQEEEAGSWTVEGIGEDFVPPNADLSLVHKAYSIPDQESLLPRATCCATEGILAGSSSGTLLAAALRYCREQTSRSASSPSSATAAKNISPRCSTDFCGRSRAGDQRAPRRPCAISSPAASRRRRRSSVRPDDTLLTAFVRMRAADVSQLPVLDGDKLVGIVDESDMLGAVLDELRASVRAPVKDVMVTRLETIQADAPIADLAAAVRRERSRHRLRRRRIFSASSPAST